MRVDEIGTARRPSRRARVRREEERERGNEPRLPPQVPDDAVPVREPEVPERGGRDDRDFDPRLPQVVDGIPHERPRDVVRAARIRGGQDDDRKFSEVGTKPFTIR